MTNSKTVATVLNLPRLEIKDMVEILGEHFRANQKNGVKSQ